MSGGLYLHIGHMKTGSSYVQSSLAGSVELLAQHDIFYPATDDVLQAREGKVSSGNAYHLFRDYIGTGHLPSSPPANASLLFSGEHLFHWLLRPWIRDQLSRRLDQVGSLRVLMFIRDPVAHACSMYQENVKRGGYAGSMEDHFSSYGYVRDANIVLDFLEGLPSCEVTIRNYSALNAVLPSVETWLPLPAGSLAIPSGNVVNRSLSAAELELQRLLNGAIGRSGHLLSARLCDELPAIRADDIRPALAVQEKLWDRLAPEIERMNARVRPEDRYVRERDIIKPTQRHEAFTFNREQLAVVAASIAAQAKTITRLNGQVRDLSDDETAHAREMGFIARELNSIRSTTSWRLTKPLRTFVIKARRLFRRRALVQPNPPT